MLQMLLNFLFNVVSQSSLQALPWALVAACVLGGTQFLSRRNVRSAAKFAGSGFLVTYLVVKFFAYMAMPAHVGFLLGQTWPLIFTAAIIAGISACGFLRDDDEYGSRSWDRDDRKKGVTDSDRKSQAATRGLFIGVGAIVLVVLALVVVSLLNRIGDGTVKRYSTLSNIAVAQKSQTMPQTDQKHIVMVTRSMAAGIGKQYISKGGRDAGISNLGSMYKTDENHYTIQSVKGHLYWIAPLIYANDWQQFTIGGVHEYVSPGFIAVDAENPDGTPLVKLGYKIHYSPDAWFQYDVNRHAYTNGFSSGDLNDATFEVNDDWQPFYTISYSKPAFINTGDQVHLVLVVDAQSGKIESYKLGEQPAWVDRVIPQSMASWYVNNWGKYNDQNAGWWNPSGQNQMKSEGDPELVYNNVDEPVWLFPMQSNNASDNSATGVVLYNTRTQKGAFYPSVAITAVGSSVTDAFQNSSLNLKHYTVASIQLYQINGRPTWVGIYSQPGGQSTFAAIGLLDAGIQVNPANVTFALDKGSALSAYASWIATGDNNGGPVSSQGDPSKEIHGKIARVSWTVINGSPTYFFSIVGDKHTYTASLKANGSLPLVRDGDEVTFSYLDTTQGVVPVKELTDNTIGR